VTHGHWIAAVVLTMGLAASAQAAGEGGISFASRPAIAGVAGEGYEYAPKVTGAEGVTFRFATAPEGMKIDAKTGAVTWTPAQNQAPYQKVVIEAEAAGQKAVQEFEVFVVGLNDAQAEAMKKVHAGFTGVPHSFAAFGDSIASAAWVLDIVWRTQDHSPAWNKASGYVFTERGPEHCSQGGWKTTNAVGDLDGKCKPTVIEYALTNDKPEVATIMYGTNDAVNLPTEEYAKNLAFIVDKCIEHRCIPILCIPTRYTWKKQDGSMFDATRFFPEIRRIAQERNVPLIDLNALFESEPDPLSLFGDGVHPNNTQETGPYPLSDHRFGYTIINHAVYHMYRALIDRGVIADVPR
jgi:lysophospholipase L1-like esterase